MSKEIAVTGVLAGEPQKLLFEYARLAGCDRKGRRAANVRYYAHVMTEPFELGEKNPQGRARGGSSASQIDSTAWQKARESAKAEVPEKRSAKSKTSSTLRPSASFSIPRYL